MESNTTSKLIAFLSLICGLALSAVAIYYSVSGLAAIFAAAVVPIVIMGTTLEISKLVATVWLKNNWKIAHWSVRVYLLIAIVVLMFITSMGIFGFLSKSHLDQGIPTGNIAAQVALIDEKIKTEQGNIDAARKTIQQMDSAVDQVMSRSTGETGAARSNAIRKSQQKERSQLQADITSSQKTIAQLNAEKAPIAASLRSVEAEVGPIKYIAAFFYDSTDPAILERAVTWVIMIIIVVFDPLAVALLLASQVSFQYLRSREETIQPIPVSAPPAVIEPVNTVPVIPVQPPAAAPLDSFSPKNDFPSLEEVLLPTISEPTPVSESVVESVVQNTPVEPELYVASTIEEDVAEIPEPHNWVTGINVDSAHTVDWTQIPAGQEYININGQKMSVRAAKVLYPQSK